MKQDYLVGLLVAATLAVISTTISNYLAVQRLSIEIHHIDEQVNVIESYWSEWLTTQR